MASQPATLYGVSHSMYTGRARSYLIKADIPYREQAPNTGHYMKTVLPKAGGRFSMPTLELADGSVIRDSGAISDYFEQDRGHTFSPVTPKQRVVSRLFDVIGAEGLMRPAMHYRWNFEAENLEFIMSHMNMITPPGDAGLVGFECKDETYLDNDGIPDTLMDLLSTMAQDFVPETLAVAEVINNWIAEQDELPSGTQCQRGVGFAEFDVSGTKISALAQPYRFYLLKRVQDEYAALDTDDKAAVDAMLDACSMTPVLGATLTRELGLQNNLEVWL